MGTSELNGVLAGRADDRLGELVDSLEQRLAGDPSLSFQIAAYVGGEIVLDAWGGPHISGDSLIVPYSVSKNTIGVSVALLVQRGLLDLDATVASYWPEFGGTGKRNVTVRQLLSHQAGLPEASPRLTWDELLDHHAGAARLAASWPFWRPGSAFGYHAITIGTLADELVYRVTGRTLHDFYEAEVRAPLGLELYLGLPPELDHRRVDVIPIAAPPGVTRPTGRPLGAMVMGPRKGEPVDLANGERSWRYGHAAASATASARGIAGLMAGAVTGRDGAAPLLDADTVAVVGEQQVHGYDEVLGLPDRAHAIVFQKATAALDWGGPRSFGHDGAAGAVGCVDPDTGVAFGYTIVQGPWPGGADPAALEVARALGTLA
jgi:CubicO group peptidase (beta-lactamase class C family)